MKPALLALALLAGLRPAALVAQGPSALPPELVTALLVDNRIDAPSAPAYFTNTLPAGWPSALTPGGGAKVAGGYVDGPRIVAVFADTAKHFLSDYLTQIQRAGYFEPVVESSPGFNSHNYGSTGFFCRDSVRVFARSVPGAPVGAFIRVIAERTGLADCVAKFPPMPRESTPERVRLTFPRLAPPAELTLRGSSSGSGARDSEEISAVLYGATTPAAVLRHYVAELNAARWTANTPVLSGQAGLATLAAKDTSGAPWTGLITVFTRDTVTSVAITMYPARKP